MTLTVQYCSGVIPICHHSAGVVSMQQYTTLRPTHGRRRRCRACRDRCEHPRVLRASNHIEAKCCEIFRKENMFSASLIRHICLFDELQNTRSRQ